MPFALSSATPAATSARTSAAAALPSRIFATGDLEDREELRGDLLLAAHHAGEVYDAVLDSLIEDALDRGAVAGAKQLRPARDDVRDHERREDVVVPRAKILQSVEQLFPALQQAGPDGLHLGDAHLPRGSAVLLGVAVHDLLRRDVGDVRGCLEHLHAERFGVHIEHLLQVPDDVAVALGGGRGVQDDGIGEHRREQHRRGGPLGSQAARLEALDDEGRRRAHGVEDRGDGGVRLDVADVVVVQDLDDLRLLHALHALPCLGVVHQEHAPGLRVQEVGAGDDAKGHLVMVHGDGRPVVDLHHALGYLRDQVVRIDGQRVLAHDLPARDRELYETARHVGVERGEDHRRPPLPGHLQDLVLRAYPVGDDEHPGPELYRATLTLRAVPDHHDVPGLHGLPHGVHAHRDDPEVAGVLAVLLPDKQFSLEHLDHRPHVDWAIGERRGPPRLPDVHAREVPLGYQADQRAVVVHYGDLAEVSLGHGEPDVAQRVALVGDQQIRVHHVLDPEHDVREQLRACRPAPLQGPLGLGVHLPEPGRRVVVLRVHQVLVLGVGDGRCYGVRVGVPVPGYVDVRHTALLCKPISAPRGKRTYRSYTLFSGAISGTKTLSCVPNLTT